MPALTITGADLKAVVGDDPPQWIADMADTDTLEYEIDDVVTKGKMNGNYFTVNIPFSDISDCEASMISALNVILEKVS